MSRVKPIRVVIQGIDEVSKPMSKILNQVNVAGKNMSDIGRTLSYTLTAPVLGFGAGILKFGVDFQNQMNAVQAVTQSSTEDLQEISKVAMELGRNTSRTFLQIMQGVEDLGRAGLTTSQILNTMSSATHLAIGTKSDSQFTANMLTNVMNTFGATADEAEHYADVLAATTSFTNTTLQGLADTFVYTGAISKDFGADVKEVSTLIGLLGQSGIFGSIAGTSLRTLFTRLSSPSESMRRLFSKEGLNISLIDKETNKMRSVIDILQDMSYAMKDLEGYERATILRHLFGQVPIGSMASLVSAFSPGGSFEIVSNRIDKHYRGMSKQMSDIMMQGLPGVIARITHAFQMVFHTFGTKGGLFEGFNKILNMVLKVLERISELQPSTIKLITAIGLIAGLLGPVLLGLGVFLQLIAKGGLVFLAFNKTLLFFGKIVAGIVKVFSTVLVVIKSVVALIAIFGFKITIPLMILASIGAFILYFQFKLLRGLLRTVRLSENWRKISVKIFDIVKRLAGYFVRIISYIFGGSVSDEEFMNTPMYHFFDSVAKLLLWILDLIDSAITKLGRFARFAKNTYEFFTGSRTDSDGVRDRTASENANRAMMQRFGSPYSTFNTKEDSEKKIKIEIDSGNPISVTPDNADTSISDLSYRYGNVIFDLGIG